MPIVSFDVDGTLVDGKFIDAVWHKGIPELYARKNGISFEESAAYAEKEYDKVGDQRIEWYDIKYWFRFFNLGDDWTNLMAEFRPLISIYPEVSRVLLELSGKYELVVISNATREFLGPVLEETRLGGYFSKIFSCTSDFKQLKKSPDFYSSICNILGIPPSQLIHVGDNLRFDYLVPRELGVQSFFLDRKKISEQGEHVINSLSELVPKIRRLSNDGDDATH